ncbi:MAG: hypothetical protein ACI4O4_02295 [Candidatus Ventricola sp.]
MSAKKKKKWIASAVSLLVGAACALVLGAVFYGAMAYQLAGGETAAQATEESGGRLMLGSAQLVSEQTTLERHGGQDCTVFERRYQLEDGTQAEAITAQPAAYIERLSEEKWTPQLMTGFALAGLDAVYAARGEDVMLCAREGDTVYALLTQADEQTLYALGAAAVLE